MLALTHTLFFRICVKQQCWFLPISRIWRAVCLQQRSPNTWPSAPSKTIHGTFSPAVLLLEKGEAYTLKHTTAFTIRCNVCGHGISTNVWNLRTFEGFLIYFGAWLWGFGLFSHMIINEARYWCWMMKPVASCFVHIWVQVRLPRFSEVKL